MITRKLSSKHKLIISALLSFFAASAFSSSVRGGTVSAGISYPSDFSGGIFALAALIAFTPIFFTAISNLTGRLLKFSLPLGALLGLMAVCGFDLYCDDQIAFDIGGMLVNLLCAIGQGLLFAAIFILLAVYLPKLRDALSTEKLGLFKAYSPDTVFFASLGLILLAWLPAFIAFFPGIFAYDVTQEVETLKAINRTNAKLAAQHSELEASMDKVREAAKNEAMLRMRGRVHDVIGQRLSVLHRALEDDAVSDEKLEQLKPLLNGILDDLSVERDVEPAEELAATIAAFLLTGVNVRVEGELPDDPAKAKVYADCIREASTNAVKHARSTEIVAKITPEGLSISNDGPLPMLPVNEGTGLSNMRHAAATIGAGFEIEASEPPFTIRLVTR